MDAERGKLGLLLPSNVEKISQGRNADSTISAENVCSYTSDVTRGSQGTAHSAQCSVLLDLLPEVSAAICYQSNVL